MERRRARRDPIRVDIDIAHPGTGRCHGHVENISRLGVSVVLAAGEVLPACQQSVMLNFRLWTGSETLCRKLYCRIVRREEGRLALTFAENDIVSEAVVQDLMFYDQRGGACASALSDPGTSPRSPAHSARRSCRA